MNKLLTFANIRPGEGAIVAWVLLYGVLTETVNTLLYTATYALFLSKFDAQRLPYIYISVSLVTTVLSLLSLRLSRRYSLAQVLLGQLSFVLITIISYRLALIFLTGAWFLFALPICYGVVNSLFFAAFWNLLGRLFNLQQGKRLFSLLGAGQQAAGLIVGFLTPAFVILFGTANLLWLAAAVAGGMLWLLLHLIHRYGELRTGIGEEAEPEGEASSTRRHWLVDPYIQLIFVMYLCFGVGDYFVDNIFYTQIESQFTNQNQLASFLGVFSGVIAGISLLSQLFIANWLLRRYGVRTALTLTPLLLLVGISLFALTGVVGQGTLLLFWLIIAVNLTRYVTDATDNTAANLLYQPLPATARTHLQTSIDGILYPLAAGVTGLLLVWLTNILHFSSLQLAYVLLPILAVWTVVAFILGRLYSQRVQQALRQRLFQGVDTFRLDRSGLESIRQQMSNPHPGAVLYALTIVENIDNNELTQMLPTLLHHPSVPVRLEALLRLERIGDKGAWPAIRHSFYTDPDPAVRTAALRTLATQSGMEHFEEVYEHLFAANPQLQQGVMVGLLRNGELEGILIVGGMLTQWINSAQPADRCQAAQVLGESGIATFYRPLLKLLCDPDPQVQRAALLAAGKLQHPKLWPAVITCLATLSTRAAAQSALVAGGVAALPAVGAALAHMAEAGQGTRLQDRQFYLVLLRICGRIRTPEAVQILLSYLYFPDFQVRTQTVRMLQQCGYQADAATRPAIEAQLEAELAQTAWLLASLVDLQSMATQSPLYQMVEESLHQQRTHLLLWLSFLYPAPTMQKVRNAFRTVYTARRQVTTDVTAERDKQAAARTTEQRAYALETLAVIVAKSITKHLLPILDDLPFEQQLKQIAVDFPQPALTVSERLLAIITGDDAWVSPWLKAAALYTAVTLPQLDDEVRTALRTAVLAASTTLTGASADDSRPWSIVPETATWALTRLAPAEDILLSGNGLTY